MTIFDIIKSIGDTKNKSLYKDVKYNDSIKSNYMLQRWLSMYNSDTCCILNDTTNKLHKGLNNDNEMWYKMLLTVIPKFNTNKGVKYIKKQTEIANVEREKTIEYIAKIYEMSTSEVVERLKEHDIDISNYNKIVKNYE